MSKNGQLLNNLFEYSFLNCIKNKVGPGKQNLRHISLDSIVGNNNYAIISGLKLKQ